MKMSVKIIIPFFVIAGFASAGCFTVYADFDPARWEYRAPVHSDPSISSDYVTLDITSDLFSHLKSDLSDLRVVSEGGEVPFVAAIERESRSIAGVPGRMFNLSTVPGDSTTFLVDLGQAGIFHNSLTIRTQSENFRRIVEVSGSDDAASWRILNPRGQIFDYTVRDISPVTVEHLSVTYPEATFRYLKIKIYDQDEFPLNISGVEVRREVSTEAREITFTPSLEIAENTKDRSTDIVLDLGTRGIPHRSTRLETAGGNFSRAVAIFESDDKSDWRALGHAYIFSIDTAKFRGELLEFSYPESNKRYLMLKILNRDDRPITVSGARITGVVRRILFGFDPARQYFIYAGNSQARRPEYDIEAISRYVDAALLNRVSVGVMEKNSFFEPVLPPLTERSPYILPVTLAAIVLVLAYLLFRLFVKRTP